MPENDEKDKKDVNAEAPLTTAKFEALPVTVIIWQPFAHIHFHSACVLCKKAVEVEALHDGSQQSRDALTDEYMGMSPAPSLLQPLFWRR